ncbi:MAG: hypothetical protein CSA62_03905 [Planctomycetota bacterium]|nr:MAG: hypothetical protein CSA62_03905 [Planctomycetota bacterium]
MPKQAALIVGLDRCDDSVIGIQPGNEARARASASLLSHPCLGAFGNEAVEVLLGARVQVASLQSALHRFLVRKARTDSRLLLQLSLPIVEVKLGTARRHHFVTRDLPVRRLLEDPFASASVEDLLGNLLSWSPAAEILVLLDSPLLGRIERYRNNARPHLGAPESGARLPMILPEPGRVIVSSTEPASETICANLPQLLSQADPSQQRPLVRGRELLERLAQEQGSRLQIDGMGPEQLSVEICYPMTAKAKAQLAQQQRPEISEPHPLEQLATQLRHLSQNPETDDAGLQELIGTAACREKDGKQLGGEELEASILDSWRLSYGELPESLRARRKELFDHSLDRVTTWFQPIVRLGRKHVRIAGWEALARDASTQKTPEQLFQCVELWGDPFFADFDAHMAETAVELFHHLIGRNRALSSRRDLYELSINVYPQSLMSEHYLARLADLLEAELILPERLVLEISEKMELPSPDEETGEDPFRDMLKRYVRELGVHFSIDDLGEGHATVDKLQDLDPLHVKIDRGVLLHEYAASELGYLIDLVGPGHLSPSCIVVEGVDEDCPLTLPELFDIGVKFVQGFSIARPSPELYPLDQDLAEFLAHSLSEEVAPKLPE